MDAEFILLSNLYETTQISWEIAIFPKGTQNGQFWPKCKRGTLCKILDFGHFFGRTSLGYKIVNTSPILA